MANRWSAASRRPASSSPAACTTTGAGITAKTVGYDPIGDIASKDDVGTYSYPASGSGSVRPHAVSSITGTVDGVTNPSYTYDGNGNMTGGAGRTVNWTAFNRADTVTQGATTLAFTYGDDHARLKQCIGGACATSATYYLNDPVSGAMSEKVVSGSTVTWHDFLAVDGHLAGMRFCTGAAPCSSGATWSYVVTDHLGSVAVMTNASGTVSERDSYDAWGRRRNSNGTDNSACSITSATTRGFTGHEEMDSICQVNANARLYDPTIARFLSADDIVPHPDYGQSYNRYSYVENNPLAATDPSGHDDIEQVPPVIGYRDPSFLNPSNPFGAGFIAALAATGIPSLPGYGSNGTGVPEASTEMIRTAQWR